MSQTNFTPISIYYSTTASAVPTAANLVQGELAINTADGKLYYEDSSGVVQVLATKSTGSIGGSNTQVQFNNSGSLGGSSGLTWDGSFLTTSSIKNSALTSGRVTFAGASGLLTDNANFVFTGTTLGIGTASPVAKLDVYGGSANTSISVRTDSFDGTYYAGLDFSTGGQGANYPQAQIKAVGANNYSANLIFSTQNSGTTNPLGERMRITSAGLVGIGTSSPGTKISILATNAPSPTLGTASGGFSLLGDAGLYGVYAGVSDSGNTWFQAMRNNTATAYDLLLQPSGGNVGIGTSSPTSFGGFKTLELANSSGNAISLVTGTSVIAQTIASNTNSLVYTGTRSNHSLVITTNDTERMRIDTSGNLLVGTTSSIGGKLQVLFDGTSGDGIGLKTNNATLDAVFIRFLNSAGSTAGNIYQNGTTSVSYATSSDYRLKENIVPMIGALAKVAQLKPVTYKWKSNGSDGQGFIAHELQEVVPDCVSGKKDAIDADGKPVYQGIDTSFLVATLTKAIQEQQALIESLTTRLTALENK